MILHISALALFVMKSSATYINSDWLFILVNNCKLFSIRLLWFWIEQSDSEESSAHVHNIKSHR